jgi:LPS export ABC transporter permease LptG/LPS export ABC transporter permease LptF
MKILDRYVFREILPPLFLSLLIFTFILEIPPVMQQLEQLVAKGVPWGVAGRILLTLIPQALGLTIPMALLVGLLIGLGRMSNDREAVALLACGVSPYRLLRPVLSLAMIGGLAHLYVMTWAIPDANQTFREITYDIVSKRVENDVQPQVFFEDFPGWVLYARDVPQGGGGWKDVLVADTHKPDAPVLYLARQGRLILDRARRTVDLVLQDGTQYSNSGPSGRETQTYRFPKELIVALDPQTVFPRMELQRGVNELRIADLQKLAAEKLKAGLPAHTEIIAIQQKFSFPFACLVFAVIGLALGLTVAREGKLAGFVVGIAVIFAYYVLMYLADSVAKGYYLSAKAEGTLAIAQLARWVPNIVLLPLGIIALIWRARWAEGRLPFRSINRLGNWIAERWKRQWATAVHPADPASRPSTRSELSEPVEGRTSRPGNARRRGTIVVIRVPRMTWLSPNILDRYISRIYLRTAAISFAALLGLFYISTFIDRADKIFKGQASTAKVAVLLAYYTPQFIYYVIPIAALLSVLVTFGLLSRTSELSVMKACGISLYRIAAPLLLLSMAWSGVLFGLEQQVMARANRRADALDAEIRGRPPRTFNPLTRRWLIGRDGSIYHYSYFDPTRLALDNLAIYRPVKDAWQLASQTFAQRVTWGDGQWQAVNGWEQNFTGPGARWRAVPQRTLALEAPDYFETEQPLAEMMTVPQLKGFIDELAASGFNSVPLSVELQKKVAFPFVTVVMTLLAVPFGMTTGKRGTLYGIGIGIVIALTYWIAVGAFGAVGKAGLLSPVLAGWAPNVLAASGAAYLLLTART